MGSQAQGEVVGSWLLGGWVVTGWLQVGLRSCPRPEMEGSVSTYMCMHIKTPLKLRPTSSQWPREQIELRAASALALAEAVASNTNL